MGIPGLLSQAQKAEKLKRPAYFKNSYFYVDGMNVVSGYAKLVTQKSRHSPYRLFIKKLEKLVGRLLAYHPERIEFYFDTYYPIDKAPLKAQRQQKNLKDLKTHTRTSYPAILAAKYLLSKGLKVVYTGLEAEDEIIKVISDRLKVNSNTKHVVFSSDSDLFTFELKNAHNVEVVPILQHKLETNGLRCINIGEVHDKSIVPRKYMRPVPSKLQVKSINAIRPMSGLLGFLNAERAHHFCKRSLALIYAPHGVNPHDIGIEIRQGTYGLIFRRWYAGECQNVFEKFQYDGEFAMREVMPLSGTQLDEFKKVMTDYSLGDIIQNQFTQVAEKYMISQANIRAVITYTNDLMLGSRILSTKVKKQAEVMFVLLKALLAAIMGWEEVLGGVIQEHNLLWRIDVSELSSYI